jgi:predicted CXXCH cytochrome family protein
VIEQMTTTHKTETREGNKVKRILTIAAIAATMLAITATPALAEGYNNGGINYTTGTNVAGYGNNAGLYVRTPNATQTASMSGPHGGYTTTTNKCQDCHSTHYAKGSYVLLRANRREDACTFCHGGGGGSTINIQMDNAYDANGPAIDGSRGMGTGHSLGYKGNAPDDINPAYTAANGLACFDCHTPHGNSARVLTTFANPGRAYFEDPSKPGSKNWVTAINGNKAAVGSSVIIGGVTFNAVNDPTYGPVYDLNTSPSTVPTATMWGLTPVEGNFVIRTAATVKAVVKPVWPTGRFLLLKNPDNLEPVSDVATSSSDPSATVPTGAIYKTADHGYNKLSINWDDPLGPADVAYGGEQDKNGGAFPSSPNGILAESEFCTDCHDGAAGSSGQPANVWVPSQENSVTGSYQVAYAHDAQPRH